jgi:anti-sigma-K factor RskA
MTVSDETLAAYADGELDASGRERVETSMAADPEVAKRIAALRALRNQLNVEFDKVLLEPVPQHLLALARSASTGIKAGKVLEFPAERRQRSPWVQWGSLAASFVLGALLWQFASRAYFARPITESNGHLVASGTLASALSNHLASQQASTDPVQIGLTFRSRQGRYCRTFQLRQSESTAGLACREANGWKVEVLAQAASSAPVQEQYRQAASALPPSVLKAVEDAISGDPLDASAEATARLNGWRGP